MSVDQMCACSDASDSEAEAGLPIVIGKSLPLVIYTVPNLTSKLASSNDPMYTESRCFELETDGAIVDHMVDQLTEEDS